MTRNILANTDRHFVWRALSYAASFIMVLLPFHTFFTTWLGASFGHINLFRVWKEVILLVMLVVVFVTAPRQIVKTVRKDRLFQLIMLYIAMVITWGVVAYGLRTVTLAALAQGLIIDLRFLVFFCVVWLITLHDEWLVKHWKQLLIWPAIIVVTFGLLQHYVLPANFLVHFGYGPHTVVPYETVDSNPLYPRVQSTTRGANPLGAYLILIITVLVALIMKRREKRSINVLVTLLSLPVLYYTYSRSAMIGLVLSIALLIWYIAIRWRRALVGVAVAVLLLGSLGAYIFRNNVAVEDTLLHTSRVTHSKVSSNQQRASALEDGLHYLIVHPFGTGTGTAGPASFRNHGKAIIAENYYIQVGQEVGIIGMILFMGINVIVGWRLWKQRTQLLPLILLCSLIGISFVNLLSHEWADEMLSYVWWGLAGAAIAMYGQKKGYL